MAENFDTENKEYQKKINRDGNFPYLFKFKQFKAFALTSVKLYFRNDVPAAFVGRGKVHIGA